MKFTTAPILFFTLFLNSNQLYAKFTCGPYADREACQRAADDEHDLEQTRALETLESVRDDKDNFLTLAIAHANLQTVEQTYQTNLNDCSRTCR